MIGIMCARSNVLSRDILIGRTDLFAFINIFVWIGLEFERRFHILKRLKIIDLIGDFDADRGHTCSHSEHSR